MNLIDLVNKENQVVKNKPKKAESSPSIKGGNVMKSKTPRFKYKGPQFEVNPQTYDPSKPVKK